LINGACLTALTGLTGLLSEFFPYQRDWLIYSYQPLFRLEGKNTYYKFEVTLNPYFFPISYLLNEGKKYVNSIPHFIAESALKNSPYYMLLGVPLEMTKRGLKWMYRKVKKS